HARPANPTGQTGLTLAQTAHQQQSQHLLNLPHVESPCWHLAPFARKTKMPLSEPFSPLIPTARRPPYRRPLERGRLHLGRVAAFTSESVAAFASESLAAFARNTQTSLLVVSIRRTLPSLSYILTE